ALALPRKSRYLRGSRRRDWPRFQRRQRAPGASSGATATHADARATCGRATRYSAGPASGARTKSRTKSSGDTGPVQSARADARSACAPASRILSQESACLTGAGRDAPCVQGSSAAPVSATLSLKFEVEEGFHRTKNVRWRTVSPLRDGKKRRPSGRNDRFWVVDDVKESNFSEVGFSQVNRLKQKKEALACNWSSSSLRLLLTSS